MNPQKVPNRCCLTLLTDIGTQNTHVGQIKGVVLGINPQVQMVDLSHEIPAQQVLRGAFAWSDAVAAFPSGTIHVGVVDPGVGNERRLVAVEIGTQRFVCPDNGLLSVILQRAEVRRAVCLDDRRWWRSGASDRFHGRDILAPVAAAWSLGHDLAEFGSPPSSPLITLPMAEVTRGRASLTGIVIDIDRFGNLITNVDFHGLSLNLGTLKVETGGVLIVGISQSYADVAPGDALAVVGSAGRLKIAVRDGRAADEFHAEFGRRVVVRWTGTSE